MDEWWSVGQPPSGILSHKHRAVRMLVPIDAYRIYNFGVGGGVAIFEIRQNGRIIRKIIEIYNKSCKIHTEAKLML